MLEPDKRPIPVILYNSLSIITGRERLSCDKLIRKARRRTGLLNFGPDFNKEALDKLVQSINTEADLHPFGVLMIREKIISQLENRLWAEHWFTKYPEILKRDLLPVILITGLQRTGTTKLQRLLSGAKGVRPLWCYEALFPAPIGTENEVNKRLSKTKRNEKALKWLSPTFHNIHPIYHDMPEEDVLLLDMQFMSSSSEAIMHVPSYAQWLDSQDQTEAYTYEKKLLLLLQWQGQGSHWILKSPHHLEYMSEIDTVFPNVSFIWTHRPISECIPSFLSMLYHSRSLFSDNVQADKIKDHWLPKIKRMLTNGQEYIKDQDVNVTHISYNELISNENNTLEKLIHKLDLENLILELENENSSYKSGHHYNLEDWGLDMKYIEDLDKYYSPRLTENSGR
jgi:hypothetical protein